MTRYGQIDLVRGLESWFVPTRKGPSGVGCFELRGGENVLGTGVVGVRRAIKTMQLVVQDAREGDFDRRRTEW